MYKNPRLPNLRRYDWAPKTYQVCKQTQKILWRYDWKTRDNHGSGKRVYLKGSEPIGDAPIFRFHDYGRKGNPHMMRG